VVAHDEKFSIGRVLDDHQKSLAVRATTADDIVVAHLRGGAPSFYFCSPILFILTRHISTVSAACEMKNLQVKQGIDDLRSQSDALAGLLTRIRDEGRMKADLGNQEI